MLFVCYLFGGHKPQPSINCPFYETAVRLYISLFVIFSPKVISSYRAGLLFAVVWWLDIKNTLMDTEETVLKTAELNPHDFDLGAMKTEDWCLLVRDKIRCRRYLSVWKHELWPSVWLTLMSASGKPTIQASKLLFRQLWKTKQTNSQDMILIRNVAQLVTWKQYLTLVYYSVKHSIIKYIIMLLILSCWIHYHTVTVLSQVSTDSTRKKSDYKWACLSLQWLMWKVDRWDLKVPQIWLRIVFLSSEVTSVA